MSKRFIVFSQEELNQIKNGQIVVLKNCCWFGKEEGPFDVYFASEEWMQEFRGRKTLP